MSGKQSSPPGCTRSRATWASTRSGAGGTMTLECKNIDEKLLDFLYEELPDGEREAFQTHVSGCARCQAELDSFGRVRSAAKSLALDEPPPAASAKLLYQAAQLA